MQNDLIIHHTTSDIEVDSTWLLLNNSIHWKTCIRQIIISFSNPLSKPAGFEDTYTGAQAYKFLLEIISGLHSRIIGETEILGQFKILSEKYLDSNPKFWSSLLKDAKYIRSNFLKDYGVQSYGGAARKFAASQGNVHIVGAGHLAESILYHFVGFKKEVRLYCRDLEKGQTLQNKINKLNFKMFQISELSAHIKCGDLVLVAAPIKSAWMSKCFENKKIKIMDLRSKRDHIPFHPAAGVKYVDLDEVFDEIQNGQFEIQKRVKKIKDEILTRSLRWDHKKIIRPFGWEDLCAL